MADFWDLTNPKKPKGIKDPSAIVDIPFDWSAWLTDAADTYSSHTFTMTGVTLANEVEVAGVITAFVAGGTVGQPASVACRITTTGGRVDERTIYLKIEER